MTQQPENTSVHKRDMKQQQLMIVSRGSFMVNMQRKVHLVASKKFRSPATVTHFNVTMLVEITTGSPKKDDDLSGVDSLVSAEHT